MAESHFGKYLRDHGLRLTSERTAILREFYALEEHIEPDELTFRMRRAGVRVSRSTVYRTLDLLVQAGLARRVRLEQGQSRYERILGRARHEHMVCLECGRLDEWSDPELGELIAHHCREHAFCATHASVQVFGYCADCARTEEAKEGLEAACARLLLGG